MSKIPRPVTNPTTSDMEEGPIRFWNGTGGTLARGTLVYLSSWNAASGLPTVTKADNDASGKEAQWVVLKATSDATPGVLGKYLHLTGQNTNAATSAGDPVYLSGTAGGWTVTAPTAANAIVQVVGFVAVKSATVGVVDFNIAPSPRKIGTNELEDGAVMAAKLGSDVTGNPAGVDDSTIEVNAALLRLKDGGITNAKINAAAAIDRSKLAEDALQAYGIPIARLMQTTGIPLAASETAGNFNVAVGTNTILAQAEVTDNETEVSVAYFQFVLPAEYVAAGDVKVRLPVAIVKTGGATDNGSTIDVEAYEQSDAGAVGADLCATAAATFAALDTWYTKDFVITAAGLVAGDVINVKVTSSVIDSEAGAGTLRLNMAPPKMLIDVKG